MTFTARMVFCLLVAVIIKITSMAIVCHACTNGQLYDNRLSANDIPNIVNFHNKLRATVALGQLQNQPPAQNMQQMTWDNQLAQRAQYWANQCVYKHDSSYNRANYIGQNLALTWYGGPHSDNRQHNFTQQIYNWYGEHVYYRYKRLEKGDSDNRRTQTGHYTQVVWANTNRVGCGFARYYQTQKKRDEILYVCNYAPSGNVEGEYPYLPGKPNCEANGLSNSDINGLCKN